MQTYAEQRAFFERHRVDLQQAAERGGAPAVVALIQGIPDTLERRVLYLFARQAMTDPSWSGRSLDLLISVARAGIEEALRQAAGAPSEDQRRPLTDAADALARDLAADLADCCPEEEPHRTRAHFEAGLRAAEDSIRWSSALGKGPRALATAWWAAGMHQLSLADLAGAQASFERALAFARDAAEGEGDSLALLSEGCLGLTRWKGGDPGGEDSLRRATRALSDLLEGPAHGDDARVGLERLLAVERRYGPGRTEE